MDELKYVLKCFLFAGLLLVLSQLKTEGVTIESHIQASLVNSKTADFVNKAAQGGVKLIKTSVAYVKEQYENFRNSEAEPAKKTEPVQVQAPTAKAQIQSAPPEESLDDSELLEETE